MAPKVSKKQNKPNVATEQNKPNVPKNNVQKFQRIYKEEVTKIYNKLFSG